jgi:hypothetical protein
MDTSESKFEKSAGMVIPDIDETQNLLDLVSSYHAGVDGSTPLVLKNGLPLANGSPDTISPKKFCD